VRCTKYVAKALPNRCGNSGEIPSIVLIASTYKWVFFYSFFLSVSVSHLLMKFRVSKRMEMNEVMISEDESPAA